MCVTLDPVDVERRPVLSGEKAPSSQGLGSRQRRCPTACVTLPNRRDWVPTFDCMVSLPPRLLTIPEPNQGAGECEMPPCLCVLSSLMGGPVGRGFRALWVVSEHRVMAWWHRFVLLQPAAVLLQVVVVVVLGGVVGAWCSGPQRRGRGVLH